MKRLLQIRIRGRAKKIGNPLSSLFILIYLQWSSSRLDGKKDSVASEQKY